MFKIKILFSSKFLKQSFFSFARLNSTRINKSVISDKIRATEKLNLDENLIKENESQAKFEENLGLKIDYNTPEVEEIKSEASQSIDNNKNKEFSFDKFKKRNIELNSKNSLVKAEKNVKFSKKLVVDNRDQKPENFSDADHEGEYENSISAPKQANDQHLLDQLNRYIMQDKSIFYDEGKKINTVNCTNASPDEKDLSNQTTKDDENISDSQHKFEGVLVQRPIKGFVWGMGHQANKKKYKFEKGEIPTLDSLVKYLEASNLRDIIIVPTKELGYSHLKETSIVSVGFSSKHIYKSAKDLSVEIKNLEIDSISEAMRIYGRRDEEWLLLEVGPNISIYFLTQAFRKEVDLVDIWINKPSEVDMIKENKLKNIFYKNHYHK